MDDLTSFLNWCDVAEWRENQRQKEEEQKVLSEGIQRVRLSGISNRDFFQVDRHDAIRQEDRRRQEEERIKKEKEKQDEEEEQKRKKYDEEEKRKKKEEEQRKEEEEEHQEQSQSLFRIHQEMTKDENRRRKYDNFAKLFRKHSQ